ncbi:hypothetical protein [Sphingobacterium spiritivorum]
MKRAKAPTPKLFRILRNIGLALASAGGVLSAVSQIVVMEEKEDKENKVDGDSS